MKMKQDPQIMRLTVPDDAVRTNLRQNKAQRYRCRGGLPTIRDMALANMILDRVEHPERMELSEPLDMDAIKWAFGVVNYDK